MAGLLLALWGAPAAYGHAAFLGSDPQPGVRLQIAPAQVTLSFTEPLNRTLAGAKITRVGGGVIATRMAASQRRLVLRPMEQLKRGAYRVRWHSVSTQDGHALEGSF
ncbi:MAG: copper resistance CopC family protein, partial [Solirubrobacteraceae bacterium]